jgi:hypothetical protein
MRTVAIQVILCPVGVGSGGLCEILVINHAGVGLRGIPQILVIVVDTAINHRHANSGSVEAGVPGGADV